MSNTHDGGPANLREMARECGLEADRLVNRRRWKQADRDSIVELLRRAEKVMLGEYSDQCDARARSSQSPTEKMREHLDEFGK